ncbi:MAG: hypothetical protein A3G45_01800 [Candidatus Staskawiczbacteria bacterium RIFCSPLOWO2_12_FULL_37_15]|uniref:FAD-binding FR-type domain-containing protein n=1 Tax=Candidatus Staskawiczbacteria bacterium RIFCSPLOWO2_12_FULL_37_15 TaxID=1802218 RepID=A0A1G2IPX1_9BACT|nr:MAG: Oxidoreductase FAD/NAD(P)-binding domain protein [Parcubacteria group bacterium GW2011_GWA2_37_10]OGZ76587.1 MAG: hypothetical protein A3G45_01800 [Candidatus Staskawiczbacteria bacterium RIFCSPLOWO2_12_FULL_37_15]
MTEGFQLSVLLYNLGKQAGIIGFVCLSLLIISGDTARFFDRYFGLDKIIKFQRKFSLITAFFIVFHPLFFVLSDSSIATYLIPNFAVIPLALGAISFYIFIVVMIASHFYKRISCIMWQYIHILTYVLFFLALYHGFNLGSDSNSIYIKTLYAVLVFGVIGGAIYRIQYKIRKKYVGRFYVKKIRRETKDTFSLILTAPKKFSFKAGQFCFLRLDKNKLHARHPFTMSSSPHERNICFTIKNTGRFTKTTLNLKAGEEVIVDGPFGIFALKDNGKDSVFIAGGVGITPFFSMIKDNLFKEKKRDILLIYGSKTKEDIIFKDTLNNIKKGWFKKIYVLSHETTSASGEYERGYINKDLINKYVKNIKNSSYYICGPEAMKISIKKALFDLGVKKQNIVIENFFWC